MSCSRGCCASFREHVQSLRIGIVDQHKPYDNGFTPAQVAQEAKDIDAYKTLRSQGLQPADYAGCSELAKRATSETEISVGKLLPPPVVKAFEQVGT